MSHAQELAALITTIRSSGPDHLVVDRVVTQAATVEWLAAGNLDSDPLQDRRDALIDALRRYEDGLDVAGAAADAQRFADLGDDLRHRGASVAGTLRRIVTTYTTGNQNAEVSAEFIDVVFPPAAAAVGVP